MSLTSILPAQPQSISVPCKNRTTQAPSTQKSPETLGKEGERKGLATKSTHILFLKKTQPQRRRQAGSDKHPGSELERFTTEESGQLFKSLQTWHGIAYWSSRIYSTVESAFPMTKLDKNLLAHLLSLESLNPTFTPGSLVSALSHI